MKKALIGLFIAGLLLSSGIYFMQVRERAYLAGNDISDQQFSGLLAQSERFYLYFYSTSCDQCLSAEPMLIEALQQVPVTFHKMNVSEYPDVFDTYQQQFGLPGVPVVLRFEQGEVTGGLAGAPESVDVYLKFLEEASRPAEPEEDIVGTGGKS
jgi:thiol-disulfide isomerase/thioredoxin